MKRLVFVLLAASVPALASAAEWQTDYGKALSVAKQQDKPVFLVFTDSSTKLVANPRGGNHAVAVHWHRPRRPRRFSRTVSAPSAC